MTLSIFQNKKEKEVYLKAIENKLYRIQKLVNKKHLYEVEANKHGKNRWCYLEGSDGYSRTKIELQALLGVWSEHYGFFDEADQALREYRERVEERKNRKYEDPEELHFVNCVMPIKYHDGTRLTLGWWEA